jgi:hypothetical protein
MLGRAQHSPVALDAPSAQKFVGSASSIAEQKVSCAARRLFAGPTLEQGV